MSEVIGQILIFGILSVLLVLSMIAFSAAQAVARDRVVGLRAESAAGRVSGSIVQTALIAEQQGVASTVTFRVELPSDFEGLAYNLSLIPAAGGVPAHIGVKVGADKTSVNAALFSADAATTTAGFDLCPGTVSGGPVNVRFDLRSLAPRYGTVAAGCPSGTHTYALFLETTS